MKVLTLVAALLLSLPPCSAADGPVVGVLVESSVAIAQPQCQRVWDGSRWVQSCPQRSEVQRRGQARASATIIGCHAGEVWMLANSHIDDHGRAPGRVRWYSQTQQRWVAATIRARGTGGIDLVLLSSPCDWEVRGYRVPTQDPGTDLPVTMAGFVGGVEFRRVETTLRKQVRKRGPLGAQVIADAAGGVFTDDRPQEGQSGGPLLLHGELVGLVAGYEACGEPRYGVHVSWRQITTFLASCDCQWRSPPGASTASPATAGCDCSERWQAVEARLADITQAHAAIASRLTAECQRLDLEIGTVRSTPGPPGPPGPGVEPTDLAELRRRVSDLDAALARLHNTEFPVRTLRPDGSVFSEDVVRLGEAIEFRLVPKPR